MATFVPHNKSLILKENKTVIVNMTLADYCLYD